MNISVWIALIFKKLYFKLLNIYIGILSAVLHSIEKKHHKLMILVQFYVKWSLSR